MKTCLFLVTVITGLTLSLTACNRGPYAATNKVYKKQAQAFGREIARIPLTDSLTDGNWVGTTNFNLRKPNYVILHHTAQKSCEETLRTFTLPRTSVSSHYLICKDGTVYQMLNNHLRAWHAGVGRWGTHTDINSASVGIEIDNNGFEPFTEQQIASLVKVLGGLKKAYGIPTANFIGHSDIAPTRKVDPNVNFPWRRLAEKGFGIWWTDTAAVNLPAHFNPIDALRIIGYDTRDTAAAIQAFKRKFLQQDKSSNLTEGDKKVLYTLYRRLD